MTSISTAVGLERVSKVVGYQLEAGNFQEKTPNLPIKIAILGEANTNKQSLLDANPKEITSAVEAGNEYGFGSPIHRMISILRPFSGDGVGGIPTVVYPQEAATGSVAAERTITVSGVPTNNVAHKVVINGRENISGEFYEFVLLTTDTADTIAAKISDSINSVLGSPVTATVAGAVVTLVAKWTGLTSEELDAVIDTEGDDAGVLYTVASTVSGAGTPELSLDFGNEWIPLVINPYGEERFEYLDQYNGSPLTKTGRYAATTFKPFVSLWGSTLSDKDDIALITDDSARISQLTHVLIPAPNSKGFSFEAAANGAFVSSLIYQNTPHLGVNSQPFPDMPVPSDKKIGDFSEYNNRDFLVKRGASTVDLINGVYTFQDLVTTFHPEGEINPSFRYVRSLVQDFNIYFGYYLLEQINVLDHAIAENDQPVGVSKVIKPKQFVQILNSYADNLAERALIVDADFFKNSIQTGTGETNPDRLETSFSYKRSPYVRIASTTGKAGFAFGIR